jgi:hypothetical protein
VAVKFSIIKKRLTKPEPSRRNRGRKVEDVADTILLANPEIVEEIKKMV